MVVVGKSLHVCLNDGHCWEWARTYMKYCLCSVKDGVSLGLGLVSVLSWAVAEVPQIVTNYKHKSTEGLSFAFLVTWLVGDFFNLFGCMLEPATLPTQFYMAILYTITTAILAVQTVYYGHFYHRLKAKRLGKGCYSKGDKLQQSRVKDQEKSTSERQAKLENRHTNSSNILQDALLPSSPIPVAAPVLPHYSSSGGETFYMSARSLSKSHTPPTGLYTTRSHCQHGNEIRTLNPHSVEEPLLVHSAPMPNIKTTLCVASFIIYFLGSFNTHSSLDNRINVERPSQGVVIQVGRKLLENGLVSSLRHGSSGSGGIGTFLGWGMAAVYMGGRFPQLYLNIKRGNIEGLNPLMFVFALVGNLTYVGSILMNSVDWFSIRPNLPWLVDAGGCALLDTLILIQFIYFHKRKSQEQRKGIMI
ncbi:hypothetical protein Scep_003099 [Stephania cephalantha]|uniref:PQ-loop repeat family protein / transmembrane family protein n=1 Tax=Stephania cephalantha TaxID=152367 RepID=A0AAP0KSH3_9MAGN